MQKIVPHLWYDREAIEAANFYVKVFGDPTPVEVTTIKGTPSGDADIVHFKIANQDFMAISAGPIFKFNPSCSLMVSCESVEEVDHLWDLLSEGGTPLMDLGAYPFSQRYGWIQDRYGLSWQLILFDSPEITQKITPTLLFSGSACGKTEEALKFYSEVFEPSKVTFVNHYGEGEAHSKNAKINYASFNVLGYELAAMDNGFDVDFTFNESFSMIVNCETQAEIDYYWEKLSSDPQAEACGWLKDPFGVSWQIVPTEMNRMMSNGSPDAIDRVTQVFLKMKKFDIAALKEAYMGTSKRPKITVETTVHAPMEKVWRYFTEPTHVMAWNSASDDWHSPDAKNDLRVGGSFNYTMAAKDGSMSFEFCGVYTDLILHKHIAYTLEDERTVDLQFEEDEKGIKIIETFEAESENSLELQHDGWQAILDHFKRYVESNHN